LNIGFCLLAKTASATENDDIMTSPAQAAPSRTGNGPRRASLLQRLIFVIGCVIGLAAILIYTVFWFGHIRGEEFAPECFRRRTFQYYELPLLGWQVWPIRHRDSTNPLESYLSGERLIGARKAPTEDTRWDLVMATRGITGSRVVAHGDARILCSYLDIQDAEGNRVWLEWSKKNGPLAKVLWPAVADVSRQQLYLFTPDLLQLAERATTAGNLQREISRTLGDRYYQLAESHRQLGRHDTAIELYSQALAQVPDHVGATRGRAESRAALGKQDEAAATGARDQE
jgi:hypothetical protein